MNRQPEVARPARWVLTASYLLEDVGAHHEEWIDEIIASIAPYFVDADLFLVASSRGDLREATSLVSDCWFPNDTILQRAMFGAVPLLFSYRARLRIAVVTIRSREQLRRVLFSEPISENDGFLVSGLEGGDLNYTAMMVLRTATGVPVGILDARLSRTLEHFDLRGVPSLLDSIEAELARAWHRISASAT